MKSPWTFFLFTVLFFSCEQEKVKSTTVFPVAVKKSKLPFEMFPCKIQPPGLPDLDPDKATDFPGFVPYYELETDQNFKLFVFVSIADCATPLIVTYDNAGKTVSSEIAGTKNCDSDFNLRCVSYLKINSDLSLQVLDSAFVQINDSCEQAEAHDYFVRREGKIAADGKITFGKPARTDLH